MKSFRQFLYENDYPGSYYDQEGNFIEHFQNKEEKDEYDEQNPDVDYTFMSDKRLSQKDVKNLLKVNVSNDILLPIATAASRAALGDGLLGEIPVEQIENDIEKLKDELDKTQYAMKQIQNSYKNTQDKNLKSQLKEKFYKLSDRYKELVGAKQRYERNNYL